jgi:HEAT repeat protein
VIKVVFFSSKDKILKKYLSELQNPSPEIRSRAAYELMNLGKAHAIPHLIKALSDANKRVRWRVAYSLGDFGERGYDDAFHALIGHLKSEKDWNVRRIIVMALRHWDERAIEPLMKTLSDKSEYVRRYAVITLGFIKAGAAHKHLKKLAAQDESKAVRDSAGWALREIDKKQ